MFLDTLRDSIVRGLENVFNLFAQYNVVPVDPTVDLLRVPWRVKEEKEEAKKEAS